MGLLNSRRSNCQMKLVKVKLVKLYAVAHMGSFAELRHSRPAHSATDVQISSRNSVLHAPLRKNQYKIRLTRARTGPLEEKSWTYPT